MAMDVPGSGEHGIAVDANDNVWLTGNGDGDGQILKFTEDGKFLLQIGKGGVAADSNNTEHLSRPAAPKCDANGPEKRPVHS
jgi:hypothetical protein